MDYIIEKATVADLDQVEALYGAVCDYLARGTNYSGWTRERYPTREAAERWLQADVLHVLRADGVIAATAALTHRAEPGYEKADWQVAADYDRIIVLHTVATHPDYLGKGCSLAMMRYAIDFAGEQGMKALRLDVCDYNTPAIGLYEKAGFVCVSKYDLFGKPPPYHLYRLYEYALS